MSVFRERAIDCPACGHTNREMVAVSLHGPRVPEIVDSIVNRRFQVFDCGGCGREYVADGPVIFTDFDDKLWIGEFPSADETAWASLEHLATDSFRRSMIDFAPPFLRAEAAGFTIRTVFGLAALGEKLLVLRHRWDDRVVEALKLRFVLASGASLHPATRPQVVEAHTDRLVLALADGRSFVAERAEAEAIAADREWRTTLAALAGGPYVDLGRLMLDGRARSEYATAPPMPVAGGLV